MAGGLFEAGFSLPDDPFDYRAVSAEHNKTFPADGTGRVVFPNGEDRDPDVHNARILELARELLRTVIPPEADEVVVEEVDEEALATVLAKAFRSGSSYDALLLAANLDATKLPAFEPGTIPENHWALVLERLKIGAGGEDGLRRLLRAAERKLPGNQEVKAANVQFRVRWTDADTFAAQRATKKRDTKRLGALVDQLLATVLAARGGARLDPGFVRALEAAVSTRLTRSTDLEGVWGEVGYQPVGWLEKALERSNAVARIGKGRTRAWDRGFGSTALGSARNGPGRRWCSPTPTSSAPTRR